MAYYLRKEKKKKGIYLQMYGNPIGIKKRNSHAQKVSWLLAMWMNLISDEIPDPIAYYSDFGRKEK